jgi:hypothetical protein
MRVCFCVLYPFQPLLPLCHRYSRLFVGFLSGNSPSPSKAGQSTEEASAQRLADKFGSGGMSGMGSAPLEDDPSDNDTVSKLKVCWVMPCFLFCFVLFCLTKGPFVCVKNIFTFTNSL